MKKIVFFILQIIGLCLINKLGMIIAERFHLPLPGNVLGMLLLFIFLLTGVIKIQWIEEGAQFLNKHLSFFYIPIAVGLMNYGDFFLKNGVALAVILFGSSIIGLCVTGGVTQFSAKGKEEMVHGKHHHTL
ncbi:holin-like protein [Oikeobacillus pervagus]|uniref:Holin-like protein n=1 Tax=Oikeobacillus pervagus TaxID=1325931 RepID=A0AAJ1SZ52_9BACI|nr:CidA/LrgA family protein [Oikeobacillus pervagus]MDQ0215483.1 holin-like protein [Oikeobacillus pervagus]